jgi:outer membrane autotransporter protein
VTSTASPVTNSIVTCTGTTLNQNMPFGFGVGYGTFTENGDTIDVQSGASVTGDAQGFGLEDGNTVNNSGTITGGNAGISTFGGANITVNNLTSASAIAGSGSGLSVTNVLLSNAGMITSVGDGILATGSVTLASNTGSIIATDTSFGVGISANSVSGSNAGLISGAIAITTSGSGGDINLTSNSGTIEATSPFAIFSGGNIVIGSNSGSIVGELNAVGRITVNNTNTGSITATDPVFSDAINTNSDVTVTNSGSINGTAGAIHGDNINVTNNFGGIIRSDSVAIDGFNMTTLVNDGTVSGGTGDAVGADTASVTNNATGIIESTGTNSIAIGTNNLLLNNAGIVRELADAIFSAVDTLVLEAGSTNSGTIAGNAAAIAAEDFNLANSGTITANGFGLVAFVNLNLTNSGTISAKGVDGFETFAIDATAADIVNTSSGIISGADIGANATNVLNLTNFGTVIADRRTLIADVANITNSGTITATGALGLQAIAVISNTATIINTSSGNISATGPASDSDAINVQMDGATIDNAGMISSTGRSAIRVGSNASIINESGGTIIGVTGIVFRDATAMNVPVVNGDVFNAGTITGTGGIAINFAFTPGSGPMTLTLGPGSVINGTVLGTGDDVFQLGGKGSDTFDVDNIGATQQYQGFTTFNKVGSSIWTLTGTGAQHWSVISGTLIGDTNSLGATTYPVSAGATLEFKQDFDGAYSGAVTGGGSFAKDGAGTLILTGDNTYAGGTTISGGTLQIGDGGTTGSITGDIEADGSLAFDRSDTFTINGVISGIGNVNQNGSGTTILTAANTYGSGTFINSGTLALSGAGSIAASSDVLDSGMFDVSAAAGGVSITSLEGNGRVILGANSLTLTAPTGFFGGIISGSGALIVIRGTETLTGDNTYTGGTLIDGAKLNIGAGGKSGSIQGNVIDNGSLTFSRSNTILFAGAISGSGSVSQIGSGITILTGFNTYLGGTTISAGALQIGNGGTAGFIIGNVADNGILAFDRSDFTFGGTISGSGSVSQIGPGTTILTSNNSYTGSTTISAGTLQLGSGGTTGSIQGDVVDNGTAAIDHSDTVLFDHVISGTGGFVQLGSGTTILTGANTYTGGTMISAGTLQVANGGTSGSIVGDVGDNGTLVFDRSDSFTIAGAISGAGGVSQIGTGTTILTGTNTYTAGTTISAGTLQLGNGGTSGSIKSFVVDNGTLVFDRSDTVTLAFAISGSGSVNQIGSGVTILTATSTYTGPTSVTSGTLEVNGSIANSATTVNSGATLKGNGTVGSLTLATGGTVAPGNSIGTLHVAGNVSFAAGSIFQVEANPDGMADLIDATGSATIDHGATVQVIAAPGTYTFGTTYKIVSAAGGVSGTFAGFSLNTPILTGQLVYGANFVDLVLSPADIDLRPFEHTPNEIATGAAVKAGGPLSTIFGKFLALQPDLTFITGALDELSGEIYPSLETDELENTQVVRQSILDRLRQSTTGDASGLLAPTAAQSRTIVDGLTMWTHVFAETGSVDSDGNAAESHQNQSGFLAGIDAALGNHATLGIGGGYTHSHLNQRTSSASGGNDYVIASGGWSDGPFVLRAGGSYAWGSRNVTRHVSFPGFSETLISKEDEHASQIFGEAAYASKVSDLALEPFAGVAWTDAATASFAETGGSAALSGRGGDSSTAFTSLGLRLATNAFGGDNLAFTPRAAVAWQHAFGSLRPQQFVTFEDTRQSFLVLGTAIDADMANVEVGLDAKIGDNAKLAIGYEGLLSGRVHLNTLHAGLSWTF